MSTEKPQGDAPEKAQDELTEGELDGVAGGGEAKDARHKDWIDVLSPPPPPPPPPPPSR